ncbi:MAG: zf-HC2 domain-containing protein [Candidatus Eremiobacteraeota bacterium]|nr:zf-HC2 domain-containing protein [Candidatus Eremiobacteraeota bacterium]
MDCIELVELITDYLEGTLPHHDRERFNAHLSECPYCVIYVDQMRATLGALGAIPAESISDAAKQTLLHAFREWKRG